MVFVCNVLGIIVFVYNVGSAVLFIGQEVLTIDEEIMKRKLILRSLLIPLLWIISTSSSIALLNDDICITGAVSCYLLAGFLFLTNEWENPFSEKI
jgi:hypothetical protein